MYKKLINKINSVFGVYNTENYFNDPINENSKESYNHLFNNKSFLKGYIEPNRLSFYSEIISIVENENLFYNINTLADIGCGTGHLLQIIHQKYPSIKLIGTDFSESAIELTNKNEPSAQTQIYDIYTKNDLFFNKFELVFSTEVLEHLLYPGVALQNLLEIVSSKGALILTVPNGRLDTFTGHINFWSPESWKVFILSYCSEELYELKYFLIEKGQTNMVIILKK